MENMTAYSSLNQPVFNFGLHKRTIVSKANFNTVVRRSNNKWKRRQNQVDEITRNKKLYLFIIGAVLIICVALGIYFGTRGKGDAATDKSGPPDTEEELPPSPSILHVFKKAAVCTDGVPCSVIGNKILEKNGSAVDAAIAAMFCNGLVNMQSMGLGGGFFMTIYNRATKSAIALNARDAAPLKATEDMFKNNENAREGPLGIAVPGELRGYVAAHERFGVLPWRELIEPSLEICRTGYNMSKAQWDSVSSNKHVKIDPNLREVFVNSDDSLKKGNSLIFPSKAYCNTLRIIAEKGGNELYNGSLSDVFAKDLADAGTIITKQDLEQYRAKWYDPITVKLSNEDTLFTVPPPSGGALLGFILNVLKGYEFNPDSISTINNTVLTYHRIIETFKHAYGQRTRLGDVDHLNIAKVIQNLTSNDFANQIRMSINDTATNNNPAHYGADFFNQPDHGTAHISILAPNGDAVSVTSTINYYFGSGITGKNTGIILNNNMDDFSTPGIINFFGLRGSPANAIRPQKRPLSSMSPSVIIDRNGDVKIVIGASGGTKIISSVALVIARQLWFEQTIKEAVDAPRIHHQIHPMEIAYEYGNLKQVIDGLHELGHKTERYRDRGSIICALYKNGTAIYANADYRKGGDVNGMD